MRELRAVGEGRVINERTLWLTLPLSPSRNTIDKWHRSRAIGRYKRHCDQSLIAVTSAVSGAFWSPSWPKPWADQILICAVRCGRNTRRCDISNVIGGLKPTEDALVRAGLVPDDKEEHVHWGYVRDRGKGHWGDLPGPATHLFLAALKKDGIEATEAQAMVPVMEVIGT